MDRAPIDIREQLGLAVENPQSFLTAIKQVAAQEDKLELQKLVIFTDILKKNADEITLRLR